MQLCYYNSSVRIEWDDELKILVFTRVAFAAGELFREPNNQVIELIKEKKTHKLLTDARLATVCDPPDMEWLATFWVPRVIEAGLKWLAVVMPLKSSAEMQIIRAKGSNSIGYESMFFETMDEAKAWLKSVDAD